MRPIAVLVKRRHTIVNLPCVVERLAELKPGDGATEPMVAKTIARNTFMAHHATEKRSRGNVPSQLLAPRESANGKLPGTPADSIAADFEKNALGYLFPCLCFDLTFNVLFTDGINRHVFLRVFEKNRDSLRSPSAAS